MANMRGAWPGPYLTLLTGGILSDCIAWKPHNGETRVEARMSPRYGSEGSQRDGRTLVYRPRASLQKSLLQPLLKAPSAGDMCSAASTGERLDINRLRTGRSLRTLSTQGR